MGRVEDEAAKVDEATFADGNSEAIVGGEGGADDGVSLQLSFVCFGVVQFGGQSAEGWDDTVTWG